MLKNMEKEMEIFRAWLQKYVNEDKKITGVTLAKKIKEKGFKSSKATISAYVTGRLVNEERKFTKIPIDVRKAIVEIVGITKDQILKEGQKILSLKEKNSTEREDDECLTCQKNKDNVFKINDPLEAEHLKIIRQFRNKHMACTLNKYLVELEALDDTALAEIVVDIKNKLKEAKVSKKRTANGEE